MMACALAGPMPGSAISSSLVAVLRLTAASAHCENSASARTIEKRSMCLSLCERNGAAVARRFRTLRRRQRTRYQTFDIAADAFGHRREWFGVARRAKLRQIGLREALILADELRRKRRVHDAALAHMVGVRSGGVPFATAASIDHRGRYVVERRRRTRADVVDARALAVINEIERRLDGVVDGNEIALLLSRSVPIRSFEQAHIALGTILFEKMQCDRCHPALVMLARAVDVEVAQADQLRRAFVEKAPHILIEEKFRIRVGVARRFAFAFLAEHAAIAIHGSTRRIDKRDVVVLAIRDEVDRIAIVVAHHVAAVGHHRVRARAFMNDRSEIVFEVAGVETRAELILIEVVGDLGVPEIHELVTVLEIVDGDDAGLAAPIQRMNEIRSDEAGGARDDD